MSEYSGFMASRRNHDVGQGIGADGRRRSGVLEASWRAGGASSAELLALAAFAQDRALQIVEASAIEEFGAEGNAPPGASKAMTPMPSLLRYTLVKPRKPAANSAQVTFSRSTATETSAPRNGAIEK